MTYEDKMIVQEKIKLIDYQIVATVIFVIATISSIILLYNKKLDILNKKPIFNPKESKNINLFNSIIVLIIVLFLQYINYKNKEISEFEMKNIGPINLDINKTYLLIIVSLISLYSNYITPASEEEELIPLI